MKKKIDPKHIIGNLDLWVAGGLLVFLIGLTFVGVLKRYILRSPITWMEEVQMLLFLWVVFLGAGAAFREGSHVAIEIVVDALPKKLGALVEKLDVVIELVILGYLFRQEVIFYQNLASTGKLTTLLRWPYTVVYAVVPVGGALMIISALYGAYRQYFKKKNGKEAET